MSLFEPDSRSTAEELQCPTCGARQVWADACRRCKCDLTLVHQVRRQLRSLRRRCQAHLRGQQLAAALDTAQRCYALSGAADDARLVALCHLLGGNWPLALQLHDTAVVE